MHPRGGGEGSGRSEGSTIGHRVTERHRCQKRGEPGRRLDEAWRGPNGTSLRKSPVCGMVKEIPTANGEELGQRLVVCEHDDPVGPSAEMPPWNLGSDDIASPVYAAVEGEVRGRLAPLRDVAESVVANPFDDLLKEVLEKGIRISFEGRAPRGS